MSASAELYIEFFIRFFIILAMIISSILSIAIFLRVKDKEYLLEIAILGFLVFTVLWVIHQFSEIIFLTMLMNEQLPESDFISKTFALMAGIMIFSIGLVKNRLRNYRFL